MANEGQRPNQGIEDDEAGRSRDEEVTGRADENDEAEEFEDVEEADEGEEDLEP